MEKATKIAEEEMSMDDFPKTANGFEKAFASLKKNPEAFYKYLYVFFLFKFRNLSQKN